MEPDDILFDCAETYKTKNRDYGDSWRTVGHILYMLAGEEPVTLETANDFISFGLYTRRLDKLARAFHGEFVADSMNHESVEDSHRDEATYAAMSASVRDAPTADHGVIPNEP